ncbi:MAG: hypothetical protein J6S14_12480 [Clostridia bacterium]|nr:hypothetical protein [Clostridia bacterium]
MGVRAEIADVIKSLRWLSEELRAEKRANEAKICRVAADRLKKIDEHCAEFASILPACEGCEGKTVFGERTESCVYNIDDMYCMDRARKNYFALKDRAEKSEAEVERLERILNSYALQYGTVTDQQKVIDEAKVKVAIKIFAEIANKLRGDINDIIESVDRITDPDAIDGQYEEIGTKSALLYDLAELKKKYTEVKDDE